MGNRQRAACAAAAGALRCSHKAMRAGSQTLAQAAAGSSKGRPMRQGALTAAQPCGTLWRGADAAGIPGWTQGPCTAGRGQAEQCLCVSKRSLHSTAHRPAPFAANPQVEGAPPGPSPAQSSLTAQGALMPTPLSACFSFCSTPPFDIAAAGLLTTAGLGP